MQHLLFWSCIWGLINLTRGWHCYTSLFTLSECHNENKGCQQVKGGKRQKKGIGKRPCDAEALACPECTKGGKHDTNDKFQRVLRYLSQWCLHHCPGKNHQYTRNGRPNGCRTDTTGGVAHIGRRAAAKGDHNKSYLEPFKQHCFIR